MEDPEVKYLKGFGGAAEVEVAAGAFGFHGFGRGARFSVPR